MLLKTWIRDKYDFTTDADAVCELY